ncbi:MAG TPA: hypothetical protein IAC11_05405 [Candidatus Limiplasma pullicola]|nr:hypothetical protein [Candidatus Limiplasma pullicola]
MHFYGADCIEENGRTHQQSGQHPLAGPHAAIAYRPAQAQRQELPRADARARLPAKAQLQRKRKAQRHQRGRQQIDIRGGAADAGKEEGQTKPLFEPVCKKQQQKHRRQHDHVHGRELQRLEDERGRKQQDGKQPRQQVPSQTASEHEKDYARSQQKLHRPVNNADLIIAKYAEQRLEPREVPVPVAGIIHVLHGGTLLFAAIDGIKGKIGACTGISAHAKKRPLHDRTFIIAGGCHEHQRVCIIIQLPYAVEGAHLRIDSLPINGIGGGRHVGNHGSKGQGTGRQQQGKTQNHANGYRSRKLQDAFDPVAPHGQGLLPVE